MLVLDGASDRTGNELRVGCIGGDAGQIAEMCLFASRLRGRNSRFDRTTAVIARCRARGSTDNAEGRMDTEFNDNEAVLQPMMRFIAALALGERIARDAGVKNAATVRARANDLLRTLAGDRGQR